jgi:hypothetical protein
MDHRETYLHTIPDQNTQGRPHFSRRIFLKGVGFACLGFTPFLQACDNLTTRSENMEAATKTGSVPKAMRPPIDLAVPAKTETATFALG